MDHDPSSPVALPSAILLANYRPHSFLIDSVDLIFDLREDGATVTARTAFRRNPEADRNGDGLKLDGAGQTLTSIALDGDDLGENRYRHDDDGGLTVVDPPGCTNRAVISARSARPRAFATSPISRTDPTFLLSTR